LVSGTRSRLCAPHLTTGPAWVRPSFERTGELVVVALDEDGEATTERLAVIPTEEEALEVMDGWWWVCGSPIHSDPDCLDWGLR